jgi:two-component system, NtrC family, sensor kinase
MGHDLQNLNRRILVVDDSQTIQHDFKLILSPRPADAGIAAAETALFGSSDSGNAGISYEVDAALQGEEGVAKVFAAVQDNRPYALAFVDVRMPPGIDGVEATEKMF